MNNNNQIKKGINYKKFNIEKFYMEIKSKKDNDSLNKELFNLKEEINELKKMMEEKNKTFIDFKNKMENKNNDDEINLLKRKINEKDIELNQLKLQLSYKNNEFDKSSRYDILQKKDMMCIYFISPDQRISFAVPCIGNDIFAKVEEKLYCEYPEYRETNNTFIANGIEILRFKTISQNNLKNGKPVMIILPSKE